jgi:hypothetical protein
VEKGMLVFRQPNTGVIVVNNLMEHGFASRKTSIPKSTISLHLKDNATTNGREFIWKYA